MFAFRFMIVVSLLLFVTTSSKVEAAKNYVTGKELLRYCTSTLNTDYGYCAGFITGVADVMLLQDISGQKACHKPSVRSQELIDLVLSYMEHNPEKRKNTARSIVIESLVRAFPCKQKR